MRLSDRDEPVVKHRFETVEPDAELAQGAGAPRIHVGKCLIACARETSKAGIS